MTMHRSSILVAVPVVATLALATWFWFSVGYGPFGESESASLELLADPAPPAGQVGGVVGGFPRSSGAVFDDGASADIRGSIRRRVEEERRKFDLPSELPARSPTGAVDALQCIDGDLGCDPENPLRARSWPESQWMRERGFVDDRQQAIAERWSDAELDARYRAGDPAAVLELARRFSLNGEDIAARILLRDAVRAGNVRAAHQLAQSESGIRSAHSRPGLQWLFVARRMGDGAVDLTYMRTQFPNLRDSEIDHAMLVADRYSQQLGLLSRPIQPRPERP